MEERLAENRLTVIRSPAFATDLSPLDAVDADSRGPASLFLEGSFLLPPVSHVTVAVSML